MPDPLPEIADGGRAQAMEAPSVTTVVLNYDSPPDTMMACLESLANQTYANHRILLVDNASPLDILPAVAERFPEVEILRLAKNHGFSGGINRGVAHARGDFIFLLNFDTTVEPACIEEMVAVAVTDNGIAGVAPKMMLAGEQQVFDSLGIALADNGDAFNRGIGQPDIGQYDSSEKVFGACFGAALVRRMAFDAGQVGALDESYFMYYEDVDWCFRANLAGWSFITAPAAVVHHAHSASVRARDDSFKYKQIQLNLMRTVTRDYEGSRAFRLALGRLRTHAGNVLGRGPSDRAAGLAIIGRYLAALPGLLASRRSIQHRRCVPDADFLGLSRGERPYFDPAAYRPLYGLDAMAAAYRRLYTLTGDDEANRIRQTLEALMAGGQQEPGEAAAALEDLLDGQPEPALAFAAKMAAGTVA
jgi:GT2 family glycosyltransferase